MGASSKIEQGFPASLEQWLKGGQVGLPSRLKKKVRVQARCPTETFPASQAETDCFFEVRFRNISIGRIHAHSLLHMIFQCSFSETDHSPTFRDVLIRDEGALSFVSPMKNPYFAKLWQDERERVETRFKDPLWQDELNSEGLLPHFLAFTPDDTGWLKVKSGSNLRLFAVVDGHISWALSSSADDDMLSILTRSDKVSEEQLTSALALCGPTQITRGLVRTHAFSKEDIQGLYQFAAQERVQKAFLLTNGKVRFDLDESARPSQDPHSFESRVRLCPREEAQRALKSTPDAFVLHAVGGWDTPQKAIAKKFHVDEGLGFFQVLEARIVAILQKSKTVRELMQITASEGFSNFDSLRALWSTQLMGVVAKGYSAPHQP